MVILAAQSLRWWLLVIALLGVGLGISSGRSAPLIDLWAAPNGPQLAPEAAKWLAEFDKGIANTRSGCAGVKWSGLDANKPARAFEFQWPEAVSGSSPLVFLKDPITEKAVFISVDQQGCVRVQESGRNSEFSQRAVPSPFPNVQLYGLAPQSKVTVLLQDSKTIRPWIFVSSVHEFQRESTQLWMLLMAFCTMLLATVFVALSFGGPLEGVVLGFLAFIGSFLFWLTHNFSIGAMISDFWPGARYFDLLHAVAVAGVVFGIGVANIEFLSFQPRKRMAFQVSVAFIALTFLSSAWWQWGYKVASAMLAMLALLTLIELIRRLSSSDLSFKLFALGFCATVIGGGIQALSVVLGGANAGHWSIFAFPLGAFIQSMLWFAAVVTQVQARRNELRAKLLFDATYDALTGLYNRVQITSRIDDLCRKSTVDTPDARPLEIKGAVLFVGLDRFKIINDSLGHTAGDEMLKMVSQRLQSVCEESTLVGRFGGDEFLILTRGAQTEASVASFCLVLTTAIAEPMEVAGRQLQIGISIGVRLIDAQCRSVEEVLRDADTALHAAKTAGRSSVVVFEDRMREQLQARIKLEGDLSEALRARQFEVFFQPIVRLKDLSHAGFEALVRWRHPDGSYVSPAAFVPVAEETGMIVELGLQVMELAMQAISGWKKQGLWRHGWYVSINVSGGQLGDDSLLQHIESLRVRYGLDYEDFRLELTETAVISNREVSDRLFPLIRKRGIGLCMDDFGTGYSSLSYLSDLPFSVLKIDKSFIDELVTRKEQQALVRAVLYMSVEMSLLVIAEGVESVEQNDMLRGMDCGYGQGYLYSKPMPLLQATEWLRAKSTD